MELQKDRIRFMHFHAFKDLKDQGCNFLFLYLSFCLSACLNVCQNFIVWLNNLKTVDIGKFCKFRMHIQLKMPFKTLIVKFSDQTIKYMNDYTLKYMCVLITSPCPQNSMTLHSRNYLASYDSKNYQYLLKIIVFTMFIMFIVPLFVQNICLISSI